MDIQYGSLDDLRRAKEAGNLTNQIAVVKLGKAPLLYKVGSSQSQLRDKDSTHKNGLRPQHSLRLHLKIICFGHSIRGRSLPMSYVMALTCQLAESRPRLHCTKTLVVFIRKHDKHSNLENYDEDPFHLAGWNCFHSTINLCMKN